jgi:hypothetical protein
MPAGNIDEWECSKTKSRMPYRCYKKIDQFELEISMDESEKKLEGTIRDNKCPIPKKFYRFEDDNWSSLVTTKSEGSYIVKPGPKPTPQSNSKDGLADLMVKETKDGSLNDSDKSPDILVPAKAIHQISRRNTIRNTDTDLSNLIS